VGIIFGEVAIMPRSRATVPRDTRRQFLWAKDEDQELERVAEKEGLTASEYCRAAVLAVMAIDGSRLAQQRWRTGASNAVCEWIESTMARFRRLVPGLFA